MAPSTVNNIMREQMAGTKRFWNRINGTVTGGGSANAHTATYSVAESAYYAGSRHMIKLGATNTAAATMNINALGAVTVKDASGTIDIPPGAMTSGQYAEFLYDGTNQRLLTHRRGEAVAFANLVGSTGAVRGTSLNVSASTDNGAGDFTINFTTALGGTNYTVVAMSSGDSATDNGFAKVLTTGSKASFSAYSTTACRIVIQTVEASVANTDELYLGVVAFGGA